MNNSVVNHLISCDDVFMKIFQCCFETLTFLIANNCNTHFQIKELEIIGVNSLILLTKPIGDEYVMDFLGSDAAISLANCNPNAYGAFANEFIRK